MPTNYTPAAYESPNMADVGPAMKPLNPRMRAVVYWLLDHGKGSERGDWLDAAVAAGYAADSSGSIKVQAHRLRHDPRINAALVEEGTRRVALDLPMALRTIRSIAADPSHKDGLKAATTLAAMVGVSAVSLSKSETVHRFDISLMDQIREDCAALGIDPDEFIRGRMKDITPRPMQIEHQSAEPVPDWARDALADL